MMTDTQPTVLVQGIPTDQKYAAQTPVVHVTEQTGVDDERQDANERELVTDHEDVGLMIGDGEAAPMCVPETSNFLLPEIEEPQTRDECPDYQTRDEFPENSPGNVPMNIQFPIKADSPTDEVPGITEETLIEESEKAPVIEIEEMNEPDEDEHFNGMEQDDVPLNELEELPEALANAQGNAENEERRKSDILEESQVETEELLETRFDEKDDKEINEKKNHTGFGSWLGACGAAPPIAEESKSPRSAQVEPTESPQKSDNNVELKEVYLPFWLRWIDPTLQKSGPDTSVAASTEEQHLTETDEVTDAAIAQVIKSMDVGGESEDRKLEGPDTSSQPNSRDAEIPLPKVSDGDAESEELIGKGDKETADIRKTLVRDLREAITTKGRYHTDVAEISTRLGSLLDESNEYKQALKLYRDAVSIYSSKLGDDHTTTMDTRLGLGRVLENAGQYDEAINTYYLVTVMRRALRGENEPSAADSLVCIAHALRKKGDYVQAIKELKRALKIYRESLGDAHKKVSATVDEIASLYVTVGDFEKSASILEEVVKLKAATLGMKSKEVSATLVSLATTYECSEEFDKSMKTLKKAYKIETDLGGYSSEGATNTLNRIAHLYEATGDYNRASIAYLGVLRGRKIRLGEDDIVVGEAYYKLGRSLRETGQHEKSLKCMKEALPIFVSKGVEMQDVERIAEIMHQMALINKDKKNLSEAARIFKQELGVRRKIGQPEFPTIARTLNHLGVIEFELKNNTRALKYMVEALTIFQKRGEQGIDCAEVLFNSGLVFEACSNKQRALEAFEEAARIFREHSYEEDHPHLVKACKKIDKLQKSVRDAAS